MQIRSICAIPIEINEPTAAIRQFVRILRKCAAATDTSKIRLNLVGLSARAAATIREFNPQRVEGASFERAIEITEELAKLATGKIKSLNIHLSAEDFRWKGATESTLGKLILLDAKAFQRKQRFSLTAMMDLQAEDPRSSDVAGLLEAVKKESALSFSIEQSTIQFTEVDHKRATPKQLLVTQLAWNQLIKTVGEKVRKQIDVLKFPQLMSSDASIDYRFDPSRVGKSVRIDFAAIVQRWFKDNFHDYQVRRNVDQYGMRKTIAPNIALCLHFDKRPGAFSKAYSAHVGVELSAPAYAVMEDRPYKLQTDLLELFELFMYQWTYFTEVELNAALDGSKEMIRGVLTVMEEKTPARLGNALARNLEEFEGPRELSAKEAAQTVQHLVRAWAQDAQLNTVQRFPLIANLDVSDAGLSCRPEDGRLGPQDSWRLIFHSSQMQEKFQLFVPWRGPIRHSRFPYSKGETMGLNRLLALHEGWVDSTEALTRALAAASAEGVSNSKPMHFDLRDDPRSEQAWHLSFLDRGSDQLKIVAITIPAYGHGEVQKIVHKYDRRGLPVS